MTSPVWTGFIHRKGDGIHGVIKDVFGMTHELVGTPAIRDGMKGYDIELRLIEVPEGFSVPGDEADGIRVVK